MNIQSAARSAAASSAVKQERAGAVAVLTLDRASRHNTLSEEMLVALSQALAAVAKDQSVRAVVLASTGKMFCPGHDLKELTAHRKDADRGEAYFTQIMNACSSLMQQIVTLPQPPVAS